MCTQIVLIRLPEWWKSAQHKEKQRWEKYSLNKACALKHGNVEKTLQQDSCGFIPASVGSLLEESSMAEMIPH